MASIARRVASCTYRFPALFTVRYNSSNVLEFNENQNSAISSQQGNIVQDTCPSDTEDAQDARSLSGFGKAFAKHSKLIHSSTPEDVQESLSFPTMLRHSKFVQLGDPQGKVVEGRIFQVVGEDLYIDFGGKFHCVCQKPAKNSRDFVRGAKVRLRLQELELSSKFLGGTREITLREADGLLLGIIHSPVRK